MSAMYFSTEATGIDATSDVIPDRLRIIWFADLKFGFEYIRRVRMCFAKILSLMI